MTPARLTWRKSSYSNSGNGECVEVAWVKSSYSGSGNGECVEVAMSPERVAVRDSKAPGDGMLSVPAEAWSGFLVTLS